MVEKEIKPYISDEEVTPEITVCSVFLGILLSVVFGAANAYLGLRVGLTVSASVPSAVIAMAIIRFLLKKVKKGSILESNIVQTIGSAGESLAAGVIFTLPALFLWNKEGLVGSPSLITITTISFCGGILGVLFMVPLRKALIVKEHYSLPYPEGTACADVLLAGERGGTSAKSVFAGLGFSAIIKFLVDGVGVVSDVLCVPIKILKTKISAEIYPSLVAVGYICGFRVSSFMLAGGIIGWLVLIPLIVLFGGDFILFPAEKSVKELYNSGGADAIWSNYVRYIGAGAVAVGGIVSLLKSVPLLFRIFVSAISSAKNFGKDDKNSRVDQDLNFVLISVLIFTMMIVIYFLPQIPVSFVGTLLIILFGFFFATVSSKIVGLLGSTNNPVSGMTIATLIVSTGILKYLGITGSSGMQIAITIGAIVCIIACIAGDASQDLKTGFLLGATPKKQQIGEIIGVVSSSLVIGGVLFLLNSAWGFGSKDIPAPQATLMKTIIQGGMDGNLPWNLIFIGGFIALTFEIIGVPSVPIAIGLYLPLELSTPIVFGGIVRFFVDRKRFSTNDGTLFCSGLIAGEGLIGILLALFAVLKIDINISKYCSTGMVGGLLLLFITLVLIYLFSRPFVGKGWKNKMEDGNEKFS